MHMANFINLIIKILFEFVKRFKFLLIFRFRMGNMKRFGGSLTDSWHDDQVRLQKQIIERMNELGINFVLPAFAGFVPDSIKRYF